MHKTDGCVPIDTYGSVSGLESVELGESAALKLLFGDMAGGDKALHNLDGDVPNLLVLLLQKENNTGSLSVEGAGNVENRVLNDALDSIIRDRALCLKAVVSTTALDQVQQSGSSGVFESGHSDDGMEQ